MSRTAWTLALLVVGLALGACAAPPGPEPLPLEAAASEAFARARSLDREGRGAEALAAAEEAVRLDPDWIAPRRFLQDRERDRLRGHAELGALRARLVDDPEDVQALYLTGRLEADSGRGRFERAVRLSPREPWGWHGLAWRLLDERDLVHAERCERLALALARDGFERSYFTQALARILDTAKREEEGARLLEERLADPEPSAADRVWLELELARLEQGAPQDALRERAKLRTERLLSDAPLSDGELESLVVFSTLETDRTLLALARRRRLFGDGPQGPLLDLLEASRLRFLEDTDHLALELAARGAEGRGRPLDPELVLRARLGRGRAREAVEAWLAAQPGHLTDADGLPRDARLRDVVLRARELEPRDDPSGDPGAGAVEVTAQPEAARARAFGEALLAAGWFTEAALFARSVPAEDLDLALDLIERARAGRELFSRWYSLMRDVDRGRARRLPDLSRGADEPAGRGERVGDLEELLLALGELLIEHGPLLDPSRTWEPTLPEDLADSPRIGYGPAGEIVHPGPVFTIQDQRLGRGAAGEPVPGLAAELRRLGRFAIAGDGLGIPPDLAVLDLLLLEPCEGEHLGRPFSGSRAWCRSASVPGRAARMGARVAGAALHEGYWIDLSALEDELVSWRALFLRFPDPREVAHILAAPAPLAHNAQGRPDPDVRRGLAHPLGEADRLRLRVLLERDAWGAGGELPVSLEELVHVTCVHEEGHLCDRAELYPTSEHLGGVLALLARSGFTPMGLQRRLEYRAQLVALCRVPDPRLPLVDVLQGVEGGSDATPHAGGYRVLLGDLLVELDRALERGDPDVANLDPERVLLHQLHHLAPEALRRLALRVAEREGLTR